MVNLNLGINRVARVPQGFVNGNVGVLQVGVFPNHRNLNRLGQLVFNVVDHVGPFPHVSHWNIQAEVVDNQLVHPLLLQVQRNLVQGVNVHRLNNRLGINVTEEGNLLPHFIGNRPFSPNH